MLRRLLLEFDGPARLLPLPNGERALTNLLHLSELLQTASARLDGEAALIRHLAEAMRDEGDTPEEHIIRLESDAERVKIVTIHKSKGLEYPLVFLPFACSFRDTVGRSRGAEGPAPAAGPRHLPLPLVPRQPQGLAVHDPGRPDPDAAHPRAADVIPAGQAV